MYASWEWIPLLLALGIALFLRPWRMLRRTELLTPLLASLVIVPWIWAMPRLHTMPLQLTLTFSGIILLTLGWPLAIPVFCLIAIISGLLAPAPVAQLIKATRTKQLRMFVLVKQSLLAYMNGAMPQVAVEFGRKTIPAKERPTIDEVETETTSGGGEKAAA